MRISQSRLFGSTRVAASLLAALLLLPVEAMAQPAFNLGDDGAGPVGAVVAPAFETRSDGGAAADARSPAFDIHGRMGWSGDAVTTPAKTAPAGAPFTMTAPGPAGASDPKPQPGPAAPGYAAPFQMLPGQPIAAAAAKPDAAGPMVPDRFIIPVPRLRLEGESVSRGWVTYFTQQEAERPVTLLIGYLNAIYVMPELSRLRVTINGQFVAEVPIASAQGPTQVKAAIPTGVLRAGGNLIRLEMRAVHRTDCSIESTYDLWMEFDNALTGMVFEGGPVPHPTMVDDLPAIGVDAQGTTNIRFIHPGPIESHHSDQILLAAQALALRGRFSHPVVSIVGTDPGPAPPGTLNVVVGLPQDLRNAMAFPPPIATNQPLVRFVNDSRAGGTVLVLGGETAGIIEAAIDRLATGSAHSDDNKVAISSRFAPDAPFFTGAGSVRFSEMGVTTQEFSGRRLRLRFPIGLPADFYGAANGQARILLDAAYAPSVRPGSQLSVYVNGSLASAYMLTERHGGLMERKVIKVPLTHFRAGINRVWIEVTLDVDSDEVCGPGATLVRQQRFVVFDSSEFVMDNFARIGRSPGLAAFIGRGFPYFQSTQPVAVVMRQDIPTVAAAATVMARLALSYEGTTLVETAPSPASLASRPVLFIGDINHIPPDVLRQVGVVDASKIRWLAAPPPRDGASQGAAPTWDSPLSTPSDASLEANVRVRSASGNNDILDRWRDEVTGESGLSAAILRFERWFKSTYGISLGGSGDEGDSEPFNPPPNSSVLVAQGFAPSSNAVWTLIAGHTADSLDAAIGDFTLPEYWLKIYGQAAVFDAATGQVDIRMARDRRFIVTEPLGPSNLRLIAANWLSLNIVTYALVLVLCCIVFAVVTSLLLRRRPKGGG
ncbi:cellulose synthase subunit [Ancylobacter aquaticus]|uniref:Cyclic di-GMP-binding protein n=1 Tax=Ancylobacter aquaticus TaxID=100 RepID=A0A4R1I6V9_ANCAQ|nr:cellulose biosynthesis cyclic di-GMP-binding regulatory protein BcsB [Ancylobacter aquaticus]TCK31114.1 cellulose synthase subunit [Ancylobacter aquaticus]